MTDKLHVLFTTDDGIHILQAWSLPNEDELNNLNVDETDIGRVAYVADTASFWILVAPGGEGHLWRLVGVSPGDSETQEVSGGFFNNPGVSRYYARTDHQHSHGVLPGGVLHAPAIPGGDDGFLSGLSALFDPLRNQIIHGSPNPFTPTLFGPLPCSGTIGTATARTPDNTNYGTRKLRVGFVSAASVSATAIGLFYSTYPLNQGYFSRETGFAIKCGALLAVVSSTYSWMLGFGISNDFGMATPSNRPNTVFIGADATDVNAQIMYNDGAGACSKIDLGPNFPARRLGDFFDLLLWCSPGNAAIHYEVVLHTAAGQVFTTSGVITGANTPAPGTQWYVMLGCCSGSSGLSVAIDSTGFYGAIPF